MKIFSFLVVLFFSVNVFSQTGADRILGTYWSPEKNAKLEVFKSGSEYFGRLVWLKDANKLDSKNPEPSLRKRKLLNMVILTGLEFDKYDSEWVDGKIYDAQSGKHYSCKAWLSDNNLKLRGYIGASILGRTEEFERIK